MHTKYNIPVTQVPVNAWNK